MYTLSTSQLPPRNFRNFSQKIKHRFEVRYHAAISIHWLRAWQLGTDIPHALLKLGPLKAVSEKLVFSFRSNL